VAIFRRSASAHLIQPEQAQLGTQSSRQGEIVLPFAQLEEREKWNGGNFSTSQLVLPPE
jgi:hypothetical protein